MKWISVKDRLPEPTNERHHNHKYIITDGNKLNYANYINLTILHGGININPIPENISEWWIYCDLCSDSQLVYEKDITHWIPISDLLPNSPITKDK